jgi:hypothetical protein
MIFGARATEYLLDAQHAVGKHEGLEESPGTSISHASHATDAARRNPEQGRVMPRNIDRIRTGRLPLGIAKDCSQGVGTKPGAVGWTHVEALGGSLREELRTQRPRQPIIEGVRLQVEDKTLRAGGGYRITRWDEQGAEGDRNNQPNDSDERDEEDDKQAQARWSSVCVTPLT